MLGLLIERRLRELDLSPQTFVDRLGDGYENVTEQMDYFKSLDEDRYRHPIAEQTCLKLAGALEIPVDHIRAAASASYRRLTPKGKGWSGGGLVPHANIILEDRDGPPITGFVAIIARVDTRINFRPGSPPASFIRQAVNALRGRNLKHRKVHSVVINYDWDKAVRVDADGNELEKIGSKWR